MSQQPPNENEKVEPAATGKPFVSEDMKKLNSFYSFKVDEPKFQQIRKNSNKKIMRFALTGIVFGFFTEWLLGNTKVYSNIIKKSTMRRLNVKKKEDLKLLQRARKRGEYLE